VALTWPVDGAAVAKHLKWPDSRADDCQDDAEAAVSAIEKRLGPWHGQELTHALTSRTEVTALRLPWPAAVGYPVVASVDAVTVDGVPFEPDTVDPDAGWIYGAFRPGRIVITATARDADTVPPEVVKAGVALAAFWLRQTIGPTRPGNAGGETPDGDVQQGFAWPRRVSEMLREYLPLGAFS